MVKTAIFISSTSQSFTDRKAFFDGAFELDPHFSLLYWHDVENNNFDPDKYDLVFVHESDIPGRDMHQRLLAPDHALVIIFSGETDKTRHHERALEMNYHTLWAAIDLIKREARCNQLPSTEVLQGYKPSFSAKELADHARLSPEQFRKIFRHLDSLQIGKVLLADDELPPELLRAHHHNLILATSIPEAEELINSTAGISLAVIDLDFNDPHRNGLSLCSRLPEAKKIILSGYDSYDRCLHGLLSGADYYISKHEFSLDFFAAITRLVFLADFPLIIGKDVVNTKLWQEISCMAELRTNLLIRGEPGSGKELVARAIHHLSIRKSNSEYTLFFSLNLQGIHESDLEKRLFGSDAPGSTNPGLLYRKDCGALLLNGIEHLPLNLQVKLLQALIQEAYHDNCTSESRSVVPRLFFTTSADLHERTLAGEFDFKLFHYVNCAVITVPSLKERSADLEMLVAYFVYQFTRDNHLQDQKRFKLPDSQLKQLKEYPFTANIAELEMLVKQACIAALVLGKSELNFNFQWNNALPFSSPRTMMVDSDQILELMQQGIISGAGLDKNYRLRLIENLRRRKYSMAQIADLMGYTEQSLRNLISRSGGLEKG